MKYIASCSGGKDSVATILLALEHGEPLDEVVYCEVMFTQDISGEVPEHRAFVYDKLKPFVEAHNIPFVVLHSDKTALDCMHHIKVKGQYKGMLAGMPIPGRCEINRDCKMRPIREYWKRQPEEYTQYLGIATDEPLRLPKLEKHGSVSLLYKYGYTEAMAMELCESRGLASPIYEFCKRNGCWFCMNCGNKELEHLYRNHRHLLDLLVDVENLPNLCPSGNKMTRTETPSQIIERFRLYGQQISIQEYLESQS